MKTTTLLLAYTCDVVSKITPNPYVIQGKSDGTTALSLNYSNLQEYSDEYAQGIKDFRAKIISQLPEDMTIANLQINCIHSQTLGI